ncbi:MAG: hypothetical protein V3V99_12980 [candidate division Zixibacteria bacterium]
MSEPIEKLKADDWVPQFTASGPRLEEAIENYKILGFEVKTVAVRDLDCGECTICFEDKNDKTVMIFTRKKN